MTEDLQELNHKVAAIAGWTEVEEWNPDPKDRKPVKVYQGTNLAHPELGKFVPNYVGSIDAIWKVFEYLKLKDFQVAECSDLNSIGGSYAGSYEALQCNVNDHEIISQCGETPAIALCKLLIAITPTPIKKAEVFEATFG